MFVTVVSDLTYVSVGVHVVVGELEFDDKGRALFCEYCGWFGRGRKLQVELTR